MKLIKALNSDLISFRVDGHVLLEITPEGIEVVDAVAEIAKERLGSQISVSDWEAPKSKEEKKKEPQDKADESDESENEESKKEAKSKK